MKPDALAGRFSPRQPPRSFLGAALVAVAAALGGCASAPSDPMRTTDPARPGATRAAAAGPVETAIEFARFTRSLGPAELERERQSLAQSAGTPLNQVLQAIALAQTHGANLPRAIALLEAVEASTSPDAVEMHPLSRVLHDQYAERQRLENAAQRLTQQLERTGQQLKDSQRHAEQLQEKLDALAEIERSLSPRPAANSTSLPSSPTERRTLR